MDIAFILRDSKTIAIVGISDKPERPSYSVASYLLEHGYRIIPVNPNLSEWRGIKAYPALSAIPSEIRESVDVVDIFRKSEDVLPIVEEAIKIKAKTVWMQLGIKNEEAAGIARREGLNVIMDKCMKIEHMKLSHP